MGPWIIDVLYHTSERAAIDYSCNRVRTGSVEQGRCTRFVYLWNHLHVFESGAAVCVPLCGHAGLRGRAVGAVSVRHGKVG